MLSKVTYRVVFCDILVSESNFFLPGSWGRGDAARGVGQSWQEGSVLVEGPCMRIVCRVLPRDHKQYCKKCAIGLLFHADGFCWRLVFFVVIFHLALASFSCGLERTLFGSFVLTRQCTEAMKQVPNICIHKSNSCICEIWEFIRTRVLYIHRFANAYHVVCLWQQHVV